MVGRFLTVCKAPPQSPQEHPLLLTHTAPHCATERGVRGEGAAHCVRHQLGEQRKQVSRKPPPHTCQLLASCSAGRMRRQLGLVFLGFSPRSFPAGPARGQTLEYSEAALQCLSPPAAQERSHQRLWALACLLHFHGGRACETVVLFEASFTTERNQGSWRSGGLRGGGRTQTR